jgi:hypothetical protein
VQYTGDAKTTAETAPAPQQNDRWHADLYGDWDADLAA